MFWDKRQLGQIKTQKMSAALCAATHLLGLMP